MAEHDQQFDTHIQWVNKATSWLTRHPLYNNTEHSKSKPWRGRHFSAICFDTKGRICSNGGDMRRADEENCFPVKWVWPDQVEPCLEMIHTKAFSPEVEKVIDYE